MLNLHLNIRSPWKIDFRNIWCKGGSTPFEYKFWEAQVYRCDELFMFEFNYRVRQDHPGIRIGFGLLSLCAEFGIYDSRHWSDKDDDYEKTNHIL